MRCLHDPSPAEPARFASGGRVLFEESPKTDKFSCRVARELCIGRIGVVVITPRSSERQFRQFGHDALRFDTHVDDGEQEVEDVAR